MLPATRKKSSGSDGLLYDTAFSGTASGYAANTTIATVTTAANATLIFAISSNGNFSSVKVDGGTALTAAVTATSYFSVYIVSGLSAGSHTITLTPGNSVTGLAGVSYTGITTTGPFVTQAATTGTPSLTPVLTNARVYIAFFGVGSAPTMVSPAVIRAAQYNSGNYYMSAMVATSTASPIAATAYQTWEGAALGIK